MAKNNTKKEITAAFEGSAGDPSPLVKVRPYEVIHGQLVMTEMDMLRKARLFNALTEAKANGAIVGNALSWLSMSLEAECDVYSDQNMELDVVTAADE